MLKMYQLHLNDTIELLDIVSVLILQKEGIPKLVNHSTNVKDRYDEGKVQLYMIPTQKLDVYDYLYISIWAVNKVYDFKY